MHPLPLRSLVTPCPLRVWTATEQYQFPLKEKEGFAQAVDDSEGFEQDLELFQFSSGDG